MTVIFVVVGLILLGLAFAFKQSVLAFVAGVAFIGLMITGWNERTALYDVYGLLAILGVVLLLVSFVCGFIIQHQATEDSFRSQRREDKEFPPPVTLSEEDAYRQELDREVGQTTEARAARDAKALRKKYRNMMNR